MARLTPDPLQVDPWTNPTALRASNDFYLLSFDFDFGADFSRSFGVTFGSNAGVYFEFHVLGWYIVPVQNQTFSIDRYTQSQDGSALQYANTVDFDSINVTNPIETVELPSKTYSYGDGETFPHNHQELRVPCEYRDPDTGAACYPSDEKKTVDAVLDFGAAAPGDYTLDFGAIDLSIAESIDFGFSYQFYNEGDGSVFDSRYISIQSSLTAPKGEVVIDGETFDLIPVGVGSAYNYVAREDPSNLDSAFADQYRPLKPANPTRTTSFSDFQFEIFFDAGLITSPDDFHFHNGSSRSRLYALYRLKRKDADS